MSALFHQLTDTTQHVGPSEAARTKWGKPSFKLSTWGNSRPGDPESLL